MMPLVIDCSQLCYSAFHTMGDLSYEEKRTGVLYGFLRSVFKYANDFDTNKFIFCWDSVRSYRKDIYPEYKQNRHDKELTDEEKYEKDLMFNQRNELRQKIVPALGFKNNFIRTGFEADDIIAEVVNQIKGVTVISSDNDLWQLLDRCVIYDPKKKERWTEQSLIDNVDVDAKEWLEVKILSGCKTDNVIGIQGVGITKAIQHLSNTLPNGTIKERIKSKKSKELLMRNTRLIKLPLPDYEMKEVEIDFDEKFNLKEWLDIFNQYRFNSFLKKENLTKIKNSFRLE